MNYTVAAPKLLWLLLFVPLPFFVSALRPASFPSLDAVPRDLPSALLGGALKLFAALAMAAAILGLAQPYRLAQSITLIGTGAQVVLVFDRSLSMDFTFSDEEATGHEQTKTQIAGRLLKDFVARSPHDRFGVVAFSSAPVFVVPITEHRAAVEAAIDGLMQPGIEGTNVGLGLELALAMIAEDNKATSPAILFASDGEYGGAGFFDLHVQDVLRTEFRKLNAHFYWLFVRAKKGNENIFGLPPPGDEDSYHTKPERHMDLFFKSLGVTYRVFWADNPKAIQDAVTEIDRLETRAITYAEQIPRKDMSGFAYAIAALAALVLALAKLAETGFLRRAPSGSRRAGP
jgi:mxaC protein